MFFSHISIKEPLKFELKGGIASAFVKLTREGENAAKSILEIFVFCVK